MPNEDAPVTVEFDAVYRGEIAGDTGIPFDFAPWDIGEPQPRVVEREREGQFRSEVLDAGCGRGDHSLYLAERGYQVTGFDFSSSAIEQARERASAAGLPVEFLVTDATRLDGLEQRFTTVLDSALYHCLSNEQRPAYAAALHRVTLPGAELNLLCSADVEHPGVKMPMRETTDNLRTHLSEHWDIQTIEFDRYTTALTTEFLKTLDPSDLHELDAGADIDSVVTDDQGRVRIPVWRLHAVRR